MSDLHVIFGTGPAGCWTARALVEAGLSVRAINRSGERPEFLPADVEIVAVADAADAEQSTRAADGADVVYQCLNPPVPLWAELFPPLQDAVIAAAKVAGARYVSMENLYGFGPVTGPMTESTPIQPTTRKGRVRAEMAAQLADLHQRGELEVVTARASDYYGPGVILSAIGSIVFAPLVTGKKAMLLGSADMPHSYAYIEDVGRGLATLGTHAEAFGQVWHLPHAPARTGRESLAWAFSAADLPERISVIGPFMLRLGAIYLPEAREQLEMSYEFTEPFVVDSSAITRAFGLKATPLKIGMQRTVEWYQAHVRS